MKIAEKFGLSEVEKVFLVEKCFEKEFFWRNASKRSFSGEMRRKGAFLEKCVEKEFFRRNASKRSFSGEMRRKGAFPCFLGKKKRNASKRSNSGFFIT